MMLLPLLTTGRGVCRHLLDRRVLHLEENTRHTYAVKELLDKKKAVMHVI